MKQAIWQRDCCYWWLTVGLLAICPTAAANWADASLESVSSYVVKLYGAGGVSGIEGYQTGLLVADSRPDSTGQLVLTVDGVLLESGEAIVVLASGDHYTGQVVGVDSLTGIALLRIETGETPVGFDLSDNAPIPLPGERIQVFSNAFNIAVGDEPVSYQRGVVAAIASLSKARGVPPLLNASSVLLVDCVTSNPGAAGGAVVDLEGRLLGMVGKELRSSATSTWLNYALPAPLLREAVARAMAPQTESFEKATEETLSPSLPQIARYGIHLIPAISAQTPAYVEQVQSGSLAAEAGLRSDDLVVLVEGRSVATTGDAQREILSSLSKHGTVRLTVLRDGELIQIELITSEANE